MPSVFIKTYGCQMNERDSEAVAAQLVSRGYSLAPSEAGADVILLNTCSIRDQAEQKALGKMATLAAQRRKRGSNQVLGFVGCMAQGRGRELIERLPDVDLVLGTQRFHHAADHLDEILAGRMRNVVDIADEAGSEATIREHLFRPSGAQVTAFVSIMQGCNQYCTFCIVPYTRGPERSRATGDILAECRELVARGVKEITLLGQIVTSYGRREVPARGGRSAFVQLLDAVHAIEGLERIRFTSPHPKGYGADLIEAFTRLPKLCEHAHLPVQSGSDRLLRLMHRGYTRERFLGIVSALRAARPGIAIGTDIIVGFPGETEEDLQQTVALVREVGFDNVFAFKYSPREGTPAATMSGAVPEEVIERRHAHLLEVVNDCSARKLAQCVGRRMQVLVEGPSHRNPERVEGRTRCNRIVVFEGGARHHGQLLDVRIDRASRSTLYGDPAIHMDACDNAA
ncbi:MAG: tRNA (N6-isopentenyl adenosine(37)-C2)-methylthiotransferase MiaB [Verrucomicrobia bacterium]|nr:tRNA (N6-isopentenyl adenosine(37)-C2)-methylthiotransferase MiaB [Verrucomicrobiota bacterium]